MCPVAFFNFSVAVFLLLASDRTCSEVYILVSLLFLWYPVTEGD